MKPLVFSAHANQVILERLLEGWVESTVRTPEWTLPDPDDSRLERRFRLIPERDNRALRVVCDEDRDTIYVITAFFDRRARRP